MATKGPSNLYGNNKGTASIHINYPYAKPIYIGSNPKEHMRKHFADFGINNADEYISKAVHFANDIDRINYDSFVDRHGTTYKYNKITNDLLLVSKEGNIITYYKPRYSYGRNKGKLNWNYFDSQRKVNEDYERKFRKK